MVGTLGPGIGYGRASRYKYIATAGQTTFTGADSSASALTLAYTALPGCLKVFIDGILQSTDEYTATNGTSVVFPTGLAVGRVVEMESLSTFSFLMNIPMAMGQCVLAKNGSNITLSPNDGGLLTVNGVNCIVPAAGVSLAPTGLSVSTKYYIYAVATVGVITSLEASTTAPVADTAAGNIGVKIKTGDSTRSLVGMVYPTTGPAFMDSITQRFVRTYYNRAPLELRVSLGGGTASTTGAEINAGSSRLEAMVWADECFDVNENGTVYNGTAGQSTYSSIAFNGTQESGYSGGNSPTVNSDISANTRVAKTGLTEGYNYACVFGRVSGGTGTWYAGAPGHTIEARLGR